MEAQGAGSSAREMRIVGRGLEADKAMDSIKPIEARRKARPRKKNTVPSNRSSSRRRGTTCLTTRQVEASWKKRLNRSSSATEKVWAAQTTRPAFSDAEKC